jgi:hypothetical protein
MAAGSSQKLAFDLGGGANTAVHGGGSCQISITYETDPTKQKDPSNWKVIYSILGGCPSDTVGNLNTAIACTTENQADCVNAFTFEIPAGVKTGHAIMAWTWFNNVGNREIYMNCINTELTGDGSEMDSFPAMFVANLASIDKCPTTESMNVAFPNPGKYVTTKTLHDPYPLATPTGEGCAAGSAPSYASAQASASASKTSIASPTSPAPAPTPIEVSTAAQTPAATTSKSSASASVASSAGTCAGKTVACPVPGQVVCMDSSHFGICDVDFCAMPEEVATGTVCSNGMISRRRKRGLGEHHHFHQHVQHQ